MTQAQFIDSGIVVPVRLTHKQQRYAARCIGIDRYCYNWMVSTHSLMRSCWGRDIKWAGLAEMKRVFNELKHDDWTAFITEVSKFVAEGAFDNFRNALSNWLNKALKAGRPHLKRRRATGSGSFLAANGVAVVRYDGHRRIRLPGLGSVKLRHELPEGVPYKVVIKKQKRKVVRLSQLSPPTHSRRDEDTRNRRTGCWNRAVGGGQPGQALREPEGILPRVEEARALAAHTGA